MLRTRGSGKLKAESRNFCFLFFFIFAFADGYAARRAVYVEAVAGLSDTCEVAWSETETASKILGAILAAKKQIRVAMYALTSPAIAGALILAHNDGVSVKLKLDRLQSRGKAQRAQVERLRRAGVDVEVSKLSRTMHHKFAVIDSRLVITGSYNWTSSAEKNKENAVFMLCPKTAAEYEAEWETIE